MTNTVAQPNTRSCFICGTENRFGMRVTFVTVSPFAVEVRTRLAPQHQGHPGLVHGGVLAALLDEALGRAVLAGDPTRVMVTAKLEVEYLCPVAIGFEIVIAARVVEDHRFLVRAESEARLDHGVVAARARGTLARPNPPLRREGGH